MDSIAKCASTISKHCSDIEQSIEVLNERIDTAFDRSYADPDPASASSARLNPRRLVDRVESIAPQQSKLCDEYIDLVKQMHALLPRFGDESHMQTKALLEAMEVHSAEPIPNAGDLHAKLDDSYRVFDEYAKEYNPRETERYLRALSGECLEEAREEVAEMEAQMEAQAAEEESQPPKKETGRRPPQKAGKGRRAVPPKLEIEGGRDGGRRMKGATERLARPVTPKSSRARTPASVTSRGGGGLVTPCAKGKATPKEPASILKKPKPSSSYEPIKKAAFQRLPRNLKLGAGKLDALNEFYKKSFDVLIDNNGPMAEGKLLAAVGAKDTKRLLALRGLSVLKMKDGAWELVATSVN